MEPWREKVFVNEDVGVPNRLKEEKAMRGGVMCRGHVHKYG